MPDDAKHQAAAKGVEQAWDWWLSQHDVSVPKTIQDAVEEAFGRWLDRHGERLIREAIEKVVRERLPEQ
jgi:hypothetical protein